VQSVVCWWVGGWVVGWVGWGLWVWVRWKGEWDEGGERRVRRERVLLGNFHEG
jgi:hypothetical protein